MFNEKGQLNDEGDVLESDVLVRKEKQREINKLREKSKMPMWEQGAMLMCRYTGLDDNEFDSDFDEEDRLLPQYAEKKKKDVGFVLTDEGVSKEDGAKLKAYAMQRSQTESNQKIVPISGSQNGEEKTQKSLDSVLASLGEKKVAEEYYTPDEMAQFKRKKRRVRKTRKIEKDPIEELQLNEEDEKRGREKMVNEEEQKSEEKRLGFEKAREKEEVKNRSLKKGYVEEEKKEETVDDVLLQDQLMRARRVVLGQRRKTPEEVGVLVKSEG